ncbi:MAG: SDR family NAD(P)-dependent oxidoreductase [Actinomycetota bacterium]|jgi:NAD(P)-dependent dehydrogenase (short-subunit alcohol dehydrogenase family)
MSGQLAGQRALVTGGASGIGAEMARRFTREGASVVVADVNDGDGKQVAVEIGGEFVHLDVTDSDAWNHLIANSEPFDIVCLNAGVSTHQNVIGNISNYPLEKVDNDAYERIMRINVDGVVFGARAVIPTMVARKSGHILVTASLAGIIAIAPDPIYGLTKHGMVGLVKSLGPALEPHGVCISALCPGFVDTPLVSELAREYAKTFSMGVLEVSVAGDLAMRALTERIAGSQWTVMAGQPIVQYIPAPPFG